jgi:hypothetical protein
LKTYEIQANPVIDVASWFGYVLAATLMETADANKAGKEA